MNPNSYLNFQLAGGTVVNNVDNRISIRRDNDFSYNCGWTSRLLPAWRPTIKNEQEAIACILQQLPPLPCGVHTFRGSIVKSTID